MEIALKLLLVALLASFASFGYFALRHLAEFGPYWRPRSWRNGSNRLMQGMLLSAGTFVILLLLLVMIIGGLQ